MDALELLRTKIPRFPGYQDESDRRLADELVRSYAGEALAEMQARLEPLDEASSELLAALLLRAGFTNQIAFKAYEYAQLDGVRAGAVSASDARLLELADAAEQIDGSGTLGYLNDVRAALDARDAAMLGAAV